MKRITLLLLITCFCLGTSQAQKRRGRTKTKTAVVEKTPQQKLYEELLPSTAQVMFFDSIVVDRDAFLQAINLPKDMGNMVVSNGQSVYTNEFGNTMIFASGDTVPPRALYISHRYTNNWEQPSKISEISNTQPDFPFLMSDGITLYFSAEGEGTVGGRDIFRTTFDSEESQFYEPTNLGLPFNSPANEYMLAISDIDDIGWLVSDRNQPEGKVCIYFFEHTSQRKAMPEDTDNETLTKFASISSIANTWQFGDRSRALTRMEALTERLTEKKNDEKISFFVNDNTVYTSLSDFHGDRNRQLFQQIQTEKKQLESDKQMLENSRQEWQQASKNRRHEIGRRIINLESDIENKEKGIATKEKQLRNNENKF